MNISVNAFGGFWERDDLIGLIARNMWATGDPGLLFVDNMLKYSPLRAEDEPRYSNPCGEYLASRDTACNLVTVNAARLARVTCGRLMEEGISPEPDSDLWQREFTKQFCAVLGRTAGLACYLGNLILDFGEGYPLPEIREKTQAKKPVGVGMSGFHTALILAFWGKAPYGGEEAARFARAAQASLTLGTLAMSASFARATGHAYENAPYWRTHLEEMRETFAESELTGSTGHILADLGNLIDEKGGFYNCLTTSQAPTGSVSAFLRNIDTGIEPFFSLAVERRVLDPREGWISFTLRPQELCGLFARHPELKERSEAQTALKLTPMDQLRMLAAFQLHNHTGVSKTLNLPSGATPEEIKGLIARSRDLRLKGFTVYRDKSLAGVISDASNGASQKAPPEAARSDAESNDLDVGDDRPGRIFRARSGSLSAHITLTHDSENNIREVFVSAGDVGADINAIFTAFGMILSVALRRAPHLFDPLVKVLLKVRMDQRVVIHTKMSRDPIVGNSLPQAIGLLMRQRKDYLDKGSPVPVPHDEGAYDLCPECHKLTFKREGCCRKCVSCGYTTC
jgi:ribonucleoside-diphosphate reductase alpha chain